MIRAFMVATSTSVLKFIETYKADTPTSCVPIWLVAMVAVWVFYILLSIWGRGGKDG